MPIEYSREVYRCPGCGDPLIAVPILACSDCGNVRQLRAFTYEKKGLGFVAECVDLDLMSQGETIDEAILKIQEAMATYLQVAFEGDPMGLVLRPSPLSHQLRYHLHCLRNRLAWVLRPKHSHFVPLSENAPKISLSHC